MHQVVVAGGVVSEAVVRCTGRNDFAFPGTTQLPAPRALRYLCSFELGELVEDAVREFSLRGFVPAVVEGADLRAVLLELPAEKVMVIRPAAYPSNTTICSIDFNA